MAKKSKKTAPKAKKAAVSRSRRLAGRLESMAPSPWGHKEQALSWALQMGLRSANEVVAAAKVFEGYLGSEGRGK